MKSFCAIAFFIASVCCFAAQAQQTTAAGNVEELFGSLPKPGNLADIPDCAATNEVFWLATMN